MKEHILAEIARAKGLGVTARDLLGYIQESGRPEHAPVAEVLERALEGEEDLPPAFVGLLWAVREFLEDRQRALRAMA
jgi:hypothetical protein